MKPLLSFQKRINLALDDDQLQAALQKAAGKFDLARIRAWAELDDVTALRQQAKAIKTHTLSRLDEYLAQLSHQVRAAGGQVHFAADAAESQAIISTIIQDAGHNLVVKSKSMTSEEIELNTALAAADIRTVETDLGEWILQLAGDTPSHIVAPAIHKSRQQVVELFNEATGQDLANADIPTLTAVARQELRRQFLAAGVGISGVNFAVAETGTLVTVTNEGNGRLVTSVPPIHIALMGMEKVIPGLDDLMVLLELLPRSATGQTLTSYVQMVTGPRRAGESDGPEQLHLVILDNGRSQLLGTEFGESLQCLRCGACLNVCPVYRVMGGHAYGGVYSGPIGAVQTPLLQGAVDFADLPQASTLCGACKDVCPVQIDLPRMLLALRRRGAEETPRTAKWGERAVFKAYGQIASHPNLFQFALKMGRIGQKPFVRNGRIRHIPGPFSGWTKHRDLPPLANESGSSKVKK
ncbi:MAG: iron-sulfur cluster-binding protein [Ardenticatenaceae bacterium]|nr:iron-sulfur cluster-binding protein [Ardenticatenaceae bacterium]